jgi:hypothetical protein
VAYGTRAGVGPDKVPVLLRRGCDPESPMSCWRVRRRSERGEEVRVEGGEQGALEWSSFCAGIEDDACNAHYLRILEAVIVALVWDVRGFGDSGWSGTRLQGLRNCYRFLGNSPLLLLPPPQGLHRLPHPISTSPSPTHRLCCCFLCVVWFELNGRVHTRPNFFDPLGVHLGVATFVNQFRLLKVLVLP